MNNRHEYVLVPLCKFQNGYPPKWTYIDASGKNNFASPGFIYGYCSIFRENYAIYGQYHYHSRDKNLVFGVINKKMESVENAIYSHLRFYPGLSDCFIGRLNTKQYIQKPHDYNEIFFNVTNNFWQSSYRIIPISQSILVVQNLNENILIFTTNGDLVRRLPYFINVNGQEDTSLSENCLMFQTQIIYNDNCFSIEYFNVTRYYVSIDEYDEIESYMESCYYFDFDSYGNLLHQGKKSSFEYKSTHDFWENDNLSWVPSGLLELSFMDIQQDLFEKKLISSTPILNPIFNNAKVYQFSSGIKYWEPQLEDLKIIKKL